MATSAILPAGSGLPPPTPQPVAPANRPPANGQLSPLYQAALAAPEALPLNVPKVDPSRRQAPMVQVRPEYALVNVMSQRPGQLRKLYEGLAGAEQYVDLDAAAGEMADHFAGGGTLAQFAAKKGLDPALMYLLAVQARQSAGMRRTGLLQKLEREIEGYVDANDTSICAALNTAEAFKAVNGASDRQWMRSLYVAAITVRNPINETFEALLQRFGASGFERGAATLLKALSEDLASQRSSVPSDRLQGLLLASMVSMRHVLGLLNSSKGFLKRQGFTVERREPRGGGREGRQQGDGSPARETPAAAGVDAALEERHRQAEAATVQLVRLLLQMTASSAAVRGVPQFLAACVGTDVTPERVAKLRMQFVELIMAMPSSLWKESSHKDQLIETLKRLFEGELARGAPPPDMPGGGPRQPQGSQVGGQPQHPSQRRV